jgi:methionyl-tRNA formyltransferase
MRILVGASGILSLPTIEALNNLKEYQIVGLLTKQDALSGRGYKPTPTQAKLKAQALGWKIYQPISLKNKEFIAQLKKLRLDLILTIDYGDILPKEILQIPKYGCINLHPSLLPDYRGKAPINWVIIKGEEYTGLTLHFLDERIDCGDIILQKKVKINPKEDAGTLKSRLSELAKDVIIEGIAKLRQGDYTRTPQPAKGKFYAKSILAKDCLINWQDTAYNIHNFIRGLSPKPSAFTYLPFKGKIFRLKIYKAKIVDDKTEFDTPGEIIKINSNELIISTKKGSLAILELQLEGKKRMQIAEFLRGYPLKCGLILKG